MDYAACVKTKSCSLLGKSFLTCNWYLSHSLWRRIANGYCI